jgi:hypothetical protein
MNEGEDRTEEENRGEEKEEYGKKIDWEGGGGKE